MMRTRILMLTVAGVLLRPGSTAAQDSGGKLAAGGPEFYRVKNSSKVAIDIRREPILQRRVTVGLDNAPLSAALSDVARQAGLRLMYSNDVVPVHKLVHIHMRDATVAAALTELLLHANADVVLSETGQIMLVRRVEARPLLTPQQRPEIVRGRVLTEDAAPLRAADVFVTRGPDRETRRTLTDSLGEFRIVVPEGSGDYLVHVQAFGWQPLRQRLTRVNPADSVLTITLKLKAVAIEVDPLRVKAEREKARPGSESWRAPIGAADRLAVGVNAALSPGQEGDLAALAGMTPGVIAVPNGVSALGLSSAQNGVTLNGLAFGGATIPREARAWTRIATAAYDPSRGGFSGLQTAVALAPGGYFTSLRGHITADPSFLQASDRIAARIGERGNSTQLSVGYDGQLVQNRYYYSSAVQFSHSSANAPSLLNSSNEVLHAAGVAPDSVARFLDLLRGARLPTSLGSLPNRSTDHLTFIGRIDHKISSPNTWGVLGYADVQRTTALALAPTALPTYGGERNAGTLMMMGTFSAYVHEYVLNETKSAFTYRWDRSSPYLLLPAGRVLVTSEKADSTLGLSSLSFGGNPALDRNPTDWTWQTTSELQWYNRNSHHRVHLYAEARVDGYARMQGANRLGTFSYNSLADLAQHRPASFTRTLSAQSATGSGVSGVFAVSDTWRRSSTFQVLYGARVEGNYYTGAPDLNPEIANTFRRRTDYVPQSLHVSPRVGLTWVYGGLKQANRYGYQVSSYGTFATQPRGIIRAGLGEFRNSLRPDLLADAQMMTGLPNSSRELQCVGPGAPTPDWSGYLTDATTIPMSCAAGGPSRFTDAAPNVQFFAPNYGPERAWRANVTLNSTFHGFLYNIEAVYSINRNQPGTRDLNFRGLPQFHLTNEANRPVFVDAASIVPATGVLSPVNARASSAFGRVLERTSDLRSTSERVTLTLTPGVSFGYLSGSYTLARARTLFRGFDASTFADPRAAEWSASPFDIRHQLQLSMARNIPRLRSTVGVFWVIASGRPFTPIVAGDVNGDGLANDRAFIFSDIQTQLNGANARVRSCLAQQAGEPAAPFSCRGPWTQTLNARVQITPPRSQTSTNPLARSGIVLNLTNPLGAIDLLLHGSNNLRGWGLQPQPDPVLYRIRGFDANAQRYIYEVNPRFGGTRATHTTLRVPFRITLDIALDVGRPMARQQIDRWVKPGRASHKGTRLTADSLAKLYARGVPDLVGPILELTDSLMLTPPQVDSVRALQTLYRQRMDSVWVDLANYMADLPDQFDEEAVVRRQENSTNRAWTVAWEVALHLKTILNPLQLQMLPYPAGMYVQWKKPITSLRYYKL